MELRKRLSAYTAVHRLFGFLTEFESLTPEDLRKHAAHLVEFYPEDLEPSFVDEFVQFTGILVADDDKTISHMSELLKTGGGIMLSTFPNVAIALRIYLTHSLTAALHQLRVVASSTSNDPGPRSRQHQQIGQRLLPYI